LGLNSGKLPDDAFGFFAQIEGACFACNASSWCAPDSNGHDIL
jgi:hypothetical protein